MIRTFHYKALVIVPAIYGLLLSSDRATLVAFSANGQLGEVFANTSILGVAMLVGACSLGAAVSSLFTGQLCDKFGYLHLTRLSGLLWCLGCIGTFFSPENVYIVLCKLVKGLGLGVASVAVPLYVFDVLVAPHRASAIGWAAAFSIFGQAALYAFGLLLRLTLGNPVDAFHYSWIAEIFWGALLVVASIFLPESPKFLARNGEWVKATASLERLSSQKNISLTSVPLKPSKFGDLFSKQVRARFFFAVAVQLFAHSSCIFGVTHVIHYTLTFCRLGDTLVETLYGVFFGIQFFFTALSIFIMKNARKKDMLAYGFFLLTVAFVSLGATSYVYATQSAQFIVYAPIVQVSLVPASTVLALTGFAFSVASLLITSSSMSFTLETLPCDSRSKGTSIAMSTAWTVETLAATLGIGLANIDPYVLFFVLAVVSFCAIFVVVFVYESMDFIEGLPFPLDVLENTEPEEKSEANATSEAPQVLLENVNSDNSSESDSLRNKKFQPQNFISIHKRSNDAGSEIPAYAVTQPAHMATAKSGFTELQMKTADTRFPSNAEATKPVTGEDENRVFSSTTGHRLTPYRTMDSKVTVSGLWSEVSDQEYTRGY